MRVCACVYVCAPDVFPSIYPYEARRPVLLSFCVCVLLKFAVGRALLPTIYPAPAPFLTVDVSDARLFGRKKGGIPILRRCFQG